MRIPLLLSTTCIICVNRNGKQQPSRTQSSWTDRWKKKFHLLIFFKFISITGFRVFLQENRCARYVRCVHLWVHELEILQPNQKNLVIARVKKICVSVVFQRFLCFVLKIKFTIAENNKTLVTTLYFPSRSFSFLLCALSFWVPASDLVLSFDLLFLAQISLRRRF